MHGRLRVREDDEVSSSLLLYGWGVNPSQNDKDFRIERLLLLANTESCTDYLSLVGTVWIVRCVSPYVRLPILRPPSCAELAFRRFVAIVAGRRVSSLVEGEGPGCIPRVRLGSIRPNPSCASPLFPLLRTLFSASLFSAGPSSQLLLFPASAVLLSAIW